MRDRLPSNMVSQGHVSCDISEMVQDRDTVIVED